MWFRVRWDSKMVNKITIYFHDQKFRWYDPKRYTTAIIKWLSNDIFYHVSFRLKSEFYNESKYYEASFFGGVVSPKKLSSHSSLNYTIEITNEQFIKLSDFYDYLLGKPYDYKALITGFFGRKNENSKAYFCSELLLKILHDLGVNTNQFKTNISPKDARMILIGLAINNEAIVRHAKQNR